MAWVDSDGGGDQAAYFFPSLWVGDRLLDEGGGK